MQLCLSIVLFRPWKHRYFTPLPRETVPNPALETGTQLVLAGWEMPGRPLRCQAKRGFYPHFELEPGKDAYHQTNKTNDKSRTNQADYASTNSNGFNRNE